MRYLQEQRRRRGAVLPIVTICLVGLMGFIALAIDIGMVAVGRNQAQNAADAAAVAGVRVLDGDEANQYHQSAALQAARHASEYAYRSADGQEGPRAFAEKRRPNWTG